MLQKLANLFLGRRRTGLAGMFDHRRRGGVANAMNTHRRASTLGTIVMLAAPFVIRRLMANRASRAAA